MLAKPPLDSRGRSVSWASWRANRLADALAKRAAQADRIPDELRAYLRAARSAYVHSLAILGKATHTANHLPVADGEGGTVLMRDSTGRRPARQPRRPKRPLPDSAAASAADGSEQPERDATHPPPTHQAVRKAQRRQRAIEHQAREAVRNAQQLASILEGRQPARPAPAGASAADRLAALADRVRLRSAAAMATDRVA